MKYGNVRQIGLDMLRKKHRCERLRFFKHLTSSTTLNENPFKVLNIPTNSSYETVKSAFLKAALQHHPDHSKSTDSVAAFIRIRQAFEEIVSYQNTNAKNTFNHEKPPVWRNDVEFQDWFRKATHDHLSFDVSHQTQKEIIHVYRTMSSGGKDKGGYWEMARQMAERDDAFRRAGGGDSTINSVNQIEQQSTIPTSIRRKRKR